MRKMVGMVNWWAEVLAMALLGAVVTIVFLQIIFRSIFQQPLSWSEELARYLFVWLIFVGSATIVRVGGHPGMDIVVRSLPPGVQRLVDTAMHLLFGLILITITVTGFMLVGVNMTQPSPAMELPMGIPYAAIPLAALLMLLNVVFFVFFPEKRGDK